MWHGGNDYIEWMATETISVRRSKGDVKNATNLNGHIQAFEPGPDVDLTTRHLEPWSASSRVR